MSGKVKTVLVLSDIHVGNRIAVSPLTFKMMDGGIYHANKVQAALFKAWSDVVKDWKNPDILVINGEPIDGQGQKSRGVEQWTTNYIDQIDAAAQLVKMFGAKKIYMTRGSGYHIEQGGVSVEELFAKTVGAERINGGYVPDEFYLKVKDGEGDVTFNFAHAIGSSSSGWTYRSTAIAKEMMLGQLEKSRKHPFDILVRSHIHYFWTVQSASHLGVVTPVWELQTGFMKRQGTMGSVPDIGAVRFLINGNNYTLEKKLFKLDEARPPLVIA